jgi:hypothetical protein
VIVGVDFDTYKATLVGLPLCGGGSPVLDTVVFRKRPGDDEAYEALTRVRTLLLASPLYHLANVFFIERGWGASRKADYMMGAFFGATFSALTTQAPTNVVNAQEWKKRISAACGVVTRDGSPGRGDLKKEEAHVYVQKVAAAAGHDISQYGPDARDAYAIAMTGKWLNFAASSMIGEMNDEQRNVPASVADAAPRGAAGGVALFDPEGGD